MSAFLLRAIFFVSPGVLRRGTAVAERYVTVRECSIQQKSRINEKSG
jgi:hypothetical protein